MEKNRVHIQKCKELHSDTLKAMEAIRWEAIVNKGDRVVIKVNLGYPEPRRGVITTPELVYEVIRILKSKECEVTVVDSDGLLFPIASVCKESGLLELIEKAGAKFVNLTYDDKITVHPKNTLFVKEYSMPKTLSNMDVFITMPVLKTHDITLYTGALKNQFGCYPNRNRVHLHPHLDEAIWDINAILRPKIVIMDALTALEGNGPGRGFPVKMDMIITSNNPVSCDLVALQIMEFNVRDVKHVLLAKEVNEDADDYIVTGEPIENIKRKFMEPYDDLANKAQKFIFKHKILTKLFFDTDIGRKIIKIGVAYRKWALKGKTEYL